ncbi:MAG: hypothetical protein IAG10_31660 [Planctomycetaceae bacterium]|nr:hypothetical protein [Planctomycetaceae bacterium]
MKTLAKLIAAFCLVSASADREAVRLSAADLEVRLNDGRTLRGSVIVDQTSRDQLALELRSSGITIRRTLAWKQISDWKIVPPLPKRVAARPAPLPANERLENTAYDAALPLSELIVSAQSVSTFGRMDWDSLRLSLQGFDQLGTPVPLFGTLQVTLWGLREEVGRPQRINTPTGSIDVTGQRRLELDKIQTWTRSLDSTIQRLPGIGVPVGGRPGVGGIVYEDVTARPWSASGFGSQSVTGFEGRQDRGRPVYERNPSDAVQMLLSLPRPLPDSDSQRGPLGEVTVELLMPGVGVFAATSPGVVLVHQSPLRQELLNQSGSRFFPNEYTTDGRGFGRETRQPLQIRQMTPPFPYPTVTIAPVPVVGPAPPVSGAPAPNPVPVVGPYPPPAPVPVPGVRAPDPVPVDQVP